MTTSSDDEYVKVWNSTNGEVTNAFKSSMIKPKKGSLWIAGENGEIVYAWDDSQQQIACWMWKRQEKIWSFTTKEQLNIIKIFEKGDYIIGGSKTGMLYIWNIQSGELLTEISSHCDSIEHICISIDSSLFLTAWSNGIIKLWVLGDILSLPQGNP